MSECKSCNQHLAIELLDRKIAELEGAVNILSVYACRYAHTRQTGAANQIVNTLARIAPSITPEHRAKIIHEAVEATCNFDDWGKLGKIFNWGEALGGEDDTAGTD